MTVPQTEAILFRTCQMHQPGRAIAIYTVLCEAAVGCSVSRKLCRPVIGELLQ